MALLELHSLHRMRRPLLPRLTSTALLFHSGAGTSSRLAYLCWGSRGLYQVPDGSMEGGVGHNIRIGFAGGPNLTKMARRVRFPICKKIPSP